MDESSPPPLNLQYGSRSSRSRTSSRRTGYGLLIAALTIGVCGNGYVLVRTIMVLRPIASGTEIRPLFLVIEMGLVALTVFACVAVLSALAIFFTRRFLGVWLLASAALLVGLCPLPLFRMTLLYWARKHGLLLAD